LARLAVGPFSPAGETPVHDAATPLRQQASPVETIEVRLLNIPNPHVDGMIIAHVVGPNLVYVTDLISPRGPIGRNPATVAVGDALRKANITDSTIVGGHHGQAGRYRRGAGGQLADADCKKKTAALIGRRGLI
jgi:hypothetical protein